ncbi:MAG: Asp-tRNA(Asn)/Glu-tRNA(Gln) amidotransferase GatCAB subunit B, partial [Alphaproteobacteria bacterium]|nr:Asp-tRNA(Asn)/Glu-tRNA(Gln) amidotransferase GatCAB subunit B [Alphaproteobacteria bacterium]
SNLSAKKVLEVIEDTKKDPKDVIDELGLWQVNDTGAIEKAVMDIITGNPDKVEQVKAKPTMLGWFVGQVMKATGGKANPQAVSDLLKDKLGIN